MVKAGVLDPTKVVRTALTNAGSIASLMLTTLLFQALAWPEPDAYTFVTCC